MKRPQMYCVLAVLAAGFAVVALDTENKAIDPVELVSPARSLDEESMFPQASTGVDAEQSRQAVVAVGNVAASGPDAGDLSPHSLAGPSEGSEESAGATASTDKGVPVTFDVAGANKGGRVVCQMVGDGTEALSISVRAGSAETSLAKGHWTAAFKTTEGLFGPATSFEVTPEPDTVALASPGLFAGFFVVKDETTGEVIATAMGEVIRTDLGELDSASPQSSPITAPSDGSGLMRFDELPFGDLDFVISCAGYADQPFSLAFPGEFAGQIDSSGEVDMGQLELHPLTHFAVQLEGYQSWGSAEEFSIAHLPGEEAVDFDSSGRAVLQLGRYVEPLHLKWWWPGKNQEAVAYLDGGIPPDGEPWVIDVSPRGELEVDLRIKPALIEDLNIGKSSVQVISTNPRGDSVLRAVAVNGSGIYTIQGTEGRSAMVEFAALINDKPVSLAVEKVVLQDEGLTTCILDVASLPTKVRITNADGEPIPSAYLTVRERDNSTSWAFGSSANESGELYVALPAHIELSTRVYGWYPDVIAVDRAIEPPVTGNEISIRLACTEATTIRVSLDGMPAPSCAIELFGAHSSNAFHYATTNENGGTDPILLANGSNARARLAKSGVWTPTPFIDLQPGTNAIRSYRLGTMTLSASVAPEAVQHQVEGSTLKEWHDAGLIHESADGARRFEVPSGSYAVRSEDGTVTEIQVGPGESVQVQ